MGTEPPDGIPVDRTGGRTVDPTKNVLDLVEAATKRLDDLRSAEITRINQLVKHLADRLLDLRTADNAKIEELAAIRTNHLKEIVELTSSHAKELMVAEAKRIDAIRVVDVQAVSTANEKATAQATVLATQVQQSADTLRSLVAANAAALATQLTQIITPITERLASLEKAQYEGAGKSGVVDPQITLLLREMKSAQEIQSQGAGRTNQLQESRAGMAVIISTAIAIVATGISMAMLIWNLTRTPDALPPVVERVIISPPAALPGPAPNAPSATVVPNSYQQ